MANVYLALVHYPVYNKHQTIVSTCITGFDLHDIARAAITFGIKKYFVVNPLPAQQAFASRIVDFWNEEGSMEFNWTRAEAFKLIEIKGTLEEAIKEIEGIEGIRPRVIATSAKPQGNLTFRELNSELKTPNSGPYLIVLGTGWGLADEVFTLVDATLEPIKGNSGYNHLSVRSANAIILDRLLGQ
ncbi:MAG: RNA methyltransferase [bacterium]